MSSLWPLFAVAAAGALHGLNPATGWAFGVPTRLALAPIAAGHAASVVVVAAAVPVALQLGVQFHPALAQAVAGTLLFALAVRHFRGAPHDSHPVPPARTALALWSFIVGMAYGAGWMLVPALVPLCAGDVAVREITATGSLVLALAAVGVHMAAMLATTAAMAAGARSVFRAIADSLGLRLPPSARS